MSCNLDSIQSDIMIREKMVETSSIKAYIRRVVVELYVALQPLQAKLHAVEVQQQANYETLRKLISDNSSC